MALTVLIIITLVLIAAFAVVAMQPSAFTVARTQTIHAAPAVVFAQVDDFRNWQAWSPWAKLDPAAALTYSGPSTGVGASYSWKGNKKIGAGRMTIKDSDKPDLVRIDLEFTRPFKARNVAEFTFTQLGDQTIVSWSMSGRNGFIGKAFALCVDCDRMIGADFEKGLASMKALIESAGSVPTTT